MIDHAAPWLAAHGSELVGFRRQLHAHPELGHEEVETTAAIIRWLSRAGLAPRPLDVPTGLTCDIGTGDGPLVVLRADLDALPLDDEKDVPYRSTVAGMCHACGHDAHTAVVLGAGLVLASLSAGTPLPGTVRLVFQPAEETMPGGALDVLRVGALDGAEVAIACHCDPTLNAGQIGIRTGPITSAADSVEVVLTGPGGHTSRPYRTVDLVATLAAVASAVPSALHARVDTRSGVSLVWGMVAAGRAHNAIPHRGVMRGTVRMLDDSFWDEMPALVEELVSGVAALYGATATVNYQRGVPPVINSERAAALISRAAETVLGPVGVTSTSQSLGGEDFGWISQRVSGAMFRLGVRRPDWTGRDLELHQGSFDIDEDALAVGVRVMVRSALDALGVE